MRKYIDFFGFLVLFLSAFQWGPFAWVSQMGCGSTSPTLDDGNSSIVLDDGGTSSSSDSTDTSSSSTDGSTDSDSTTVEDAPITVEIFGSIATDSVTQPDEFTAILDCLDQDTSDNTTDYIAATCGDTADAITQDYYCSGGISFRENGGNDEELFEATQMSCTLDSDGVYTITEDELVVS